MKFYKNAFSNLKMLEDLSLKNITYDEQENPDYLLPASLQSLELVRIGLRNLSNTISLSDLKELDVSFNNLTTMPMLNKTAPLTSLSLSKNPIMMIEVEQIAPFCELNTVELEFGAESKFNSSNKGCDCFRLYNWLKKDNIQGVDSIKCGIYSKSKNSGGK